MANYQKYLITNKGWKLVNEINFFVLVRLNKSLYVKYFDIKITKKNLTKLEMNFGKKSISQTNNFWKKIF